MRILLIIIFFLGIVYLILPGPNSIKDIPQIPQSLKSDEPGDTIQVPNIAAFFSNFRRSEVTSFYRNAMKDIHLFYFPPVRFNHPPEEAYGVVRDQIPSTYLEEFFYPLRDSLYVNGFEPFDENGKPYRVGATSILINDTFFDSKTSLRFYNSSVVWRIIIYLGVWTSMYLMLKIFRKSFKKEI